MNNDDNHLTHMMMNPGSNATLTVNYILNKM